jgi:aminopeptidase N
LDPECSLLAKIKFPVPDAMLYAQLTNRDNVVSRLSAIDQLANKRDKETVSHLKQALDDDPFYGVRLEASRALRSIHTDEAFDALLASPPQPDARVRLQVAQDIGGFYRDKAFDWALKAPDRENNPDIVAAEIRELGGYAKPASHDVLLKYLHGDSYRNLLAGAAVEAMRMQDDPAWITPLLDTLRERETNFTSRGFGNALGTVAYLARNEEKRDRVCDFLLGYLNHKKRVIQIAAINALGTLGDARAIAALNGIATASTQSPEQKAAENAVADLRAGRKPVDDFKNLRQEVEDLEKANRDLRRDLDTLKKEAESWGVGPGRRGTNRPIAYPPKHS